MLTLGMILAVVVATVVEASVVNKKMNWSK